MEKTLICMEEAKRLLRSGGKLVYEREIYV